MPISRPLYYAPASITRTSSVPASMLIPSAGDKAISLLFVGLVDGKVVIITNDLKIIVRNWVTASQAGGNFTFSSSQVLIYFLYLSLMYTSVKLHQFSLLGLRRSHSTELVLKYPKHTGSRDHFLKVLS